jgi:polar amino acid transport system permease protein
MLNLGTAYTELPALLSGVPLTLWITAGAFGIGTTLALPMAAIRVAQVPWLTGFIMGWTDFFVTTPPLIHIIWMYYVLPQAFGIRLSDITVVIVALGAGVSAQMAEVFRAGLQSVPRGQGEAATVLGLGPVQRLTYVILPQTGRLTMAPACNTLAGLMKDSALAAIIGVPELMNRGQAISVENFRPLEMLTMVAGVYFVLIYPVVLAAAALERRGRTGYLAA